MHVKKQLFIICASLVISFLLAYFLADKLPTAMVLEDNRTISETIEFTPETSQTAVEGIVIANNGSDQLQVRLELRDGVRDITIPISNETTLVRRSFSNGNVNDIKTSLSEVFIGDQVSIVVLTGALSIADQTVITPIEVIIRGE